MFWDTWYMKAALYIVLIIIEHCGTYRSFVIGWGYLLPSSTHNVFISGFFINTLYMYAKVNSLEF